MDQKKILRKSMIKRIRAQRYSERRRKSRIIQKKLFSQEEFVKSKRIMFYFSKGTGEVETRPMLKKALSMGKELYLPITLVKEKRIKAGYFRGSKKDIRKGPYDIYEPKQYKYKRAIRMKDIDLVIVPGLAFDKKNNRLGRGKGYYDRFLKRLPKATPKIGICFSFQLIKKVPTTRKDFSLSKVITD